MILLEISMRHFCWRCYRLSYRKTEYSQSKGDAFVLWAMLVNTPLTRDTLMSEQESDVNWEGLNEQILSTDETKEVPVCCF